MKILNLVQGSPEWKAHRAANGHNASDAPAMLGESPYKSRSELLQERATGVAPEVDAATQRRFDDGHRAEALARPLAEKLLEAELFPCVGVSDDGALSASFDGLTLTQQYAFEHKLLGQRLRDAMPEGVTGDDLPADYRIQMEQQMMVSGATGVLFMASCWNDDDTLIEERHTWYESDPALRERIIAGWTQFDEDVKNWQPPKEAAPEAVGASPDNLPYLAIELTGMVQSSNLKEFQTHALAVLGNINTDLQTDQDFADAESTVKWAKDVESRLDDAKERALAQTADIDALFRTIDAIKEETRQKRLHLDKLVKERKQALKIEIAHEAKADIDKHIGTINASLEGVRLPDVPYSINDAMKGKKKLDSLREAAQAEAARAKAEASMLADRLRANLKIITDAAHPELFSDRQALIEKDSEALAVIVKGRIDAAAERKRKQEEAEEAERKRKAEAAAERERERVRHEEQAKARAEAQQNTPPVESDTGSLDSAKKAAPAEPDRAGGKPYARPATLDEALVRWRREYNVSDACFVELRRIMREFVGDRVEAA